MTTLQRAILATKLTQNDGLDAVFFATLRRILGGNSIGSFASFMQLLYSETCLSEDKVCMVQHLNKLVALYPAMKTC